MNWKKLLGSITESVEQELRLRNEYLEAENRVLRTQINGRVELTDSDRKELAEIGVKLGKKALEEMATIAKPDTIFAWHRTFADQKLDASEPPKSVGRPRIDKEIEGLVVRMARENCSWGYDRIQGALKHLGYTISAQTVGNILKRHRLPTAPERKKTVTWREFVRLHMDVLMATDFFTSEVWSWVGLVRSYLLFFFPLDRHKVPAVGMTPHHNEQWRRSLLTWLHDLNTDVQRWVHLGKAAARLRPIRFGEDVLRPALSECALSDSREPPLQGIERVVLMPAVSLRPIRDGPMRHRHHLGRLLKDGNREAA